MVGANCFDLLFPHLWETLTSAVPFKDLVNWKYQPSVANYGYKDTI